MIREIYAYREMLYNLVKRELRSRYKASILGFLWTFINPLMQLAIYSFVFPNLMRVTEENYTMFLFVALLPWTAFQASLQAGTTCVIANANMVKKIYFPKTILPLATVLANMINYLYCMVIVLIVLPVVGIGYSKYLLFFPVVFLAEFLVAYGLCLIFSAFNVLYRDIEHIIAIVTMMWFYATPILYNISIITGKYEFLYKLNPMVGIIIGFRNILFYQEMPNMKYLIYDFVVGLILILVGTKIFESISRRFAEEL